MGKKFHHKGDQIENLVPQMGYCIASDKVTVDGLPIGYMYREPPRNPSDSGWRFAAGVESDEYINNPENSGLYQVNTIANFDRAIIPYLHAPIGSEFERILDTDEFEEV